LEDKFYGNWIYKYNCPTKSQQNRNLDENLDFFRLKFWNINLFFGICIL
jgi:hypothetical protein